MAIFTPAFRSTHGFALVIAVVTGAMIAFVAEVATPTRSAPPRPPAVEEPSSPALVLKE